MAADLRRIGQRWTNGREQLLTRGMYCMAVPLRAISGFVRAPEEIHESEAGDNISRETVPIVRLPAGS